MKRIAVIEPDYAHFRWIRFNLRESGCEAECTRFESAVAALEYWSSARIRPDIILMSWRLPIIKGNDACRRIRSTTGFEQIPLVALVSSDTERRDAEDAGIPSLCSPVDPGSTESLRRFLDQNAVTSARQSA